MYTECTLYHVVQSSICQGMPGYISYTRIRYAFCILYTSTYICIHNTYILLMRSIDYYYSNMNIIYIYVCVYIYICVYICVCMCVCVCVCVCVCAMLVCVSMCYQLYMNVFNSILTNINCDYIIYICICIYSPWYLVYIT